MDTRDIETRRYFNQQVSFDANEPLAIGDRFIDLDLAARLTGAPDGARIVMNSSDGKARFLVFHRFFDRASEYEVEATDTGFVLISNLSTMLKKRYQNRGLGLRMFAYEAHAARELGIHQIWLWAARNDHYNGYYSWPRYGFDALLEPNIISTLPPEYHNAKGVQQIMATEAGRGVWRRFGVGQMMCFDVTDERSWKVLEAYMNLKGVSL
jgi:GNAT superfamily N-acetyltransferase